MQRLPRIVELLLIVILCGVVALWATRLLHGPSIAAPPTADVAAPSGNSRADALLASARLFGSRRPGVLSDNVRALGVIADAAGDGSVIVSVDGQPAKVYRVGDTLDGRSVSAIRPQEIELEAGGVRQVFRLPPPRPSVGGVALLGSAQPTPVVQAQVGPTSYPDVPVQQVQPTPQQPPQGPLPLGRRPHFTPGNGVGAQQGQTPPPPLNQ